MFDKNEITKAPVAFVFIFLGGLIGLLGIALLAFRVPSKSDILGILVLVAGVIVVFAAGIRYRAKQTD